MRSISFALYKKKLKMVQGHEFKDWNAETAKVKHRSNAWNYRHTQELHEQDTNSRGKSLMNYQMGLCDTKIFMHSKWNCQQSKRKLIG